MNSPVIQAKEFGCTTEATTGAHELQTWQRCSLQWGHGRSTVRVRFIRYSRAAPVQTAKTDSDWDSGQHCVLPKLMVVFRMLTRTVRCFLEVVTTITFGEAATRRSGPTHCGLRPPCVLLASGLMALACGGTVHTDGTDSGHMKCPDIPRVNAGATTGALVIRGHITDSSGAAVVGGRIELSGGASAVRYSDFTGGYTFHVKPGSYALKASGDCTLTPSSTPIENLATDQTYDFAAAGGGCVTSARASVTATGSVLILSQSGAEIATPIASVLVDPSAAAALSDLQAAAGVGPSACSLLIDGNPAVEGQQTDTIPGPLDGPDITQLSLTTAIAVGSTIVRFKTALGEGSGTQITVPPSDTIDRILAAGRNFTAEQLPELHSP